jgi:hypothetical protein
MSATNGLGTARCDLDFHAPQARWALSVAAADHRVVESDLGDGGLTEPHLVGPARRTNVEDGAKRASTRKRAHPPSDRSLSPEPSDALVGKLLGYLDASSQARVCRGVVLQGDFEDVAGATGSEHVTGASHSPVARVQIGVDEALGRLRENRQLWVDAF